MQVLRLPAVGSKRFLTTKVDRCVTGVSALRFTVEGCAQLAAARLLCRQWLGF